MASSGSFNTTDYNGRYLTLSWTETSQSLLDNATTISWTLSGQGTTGSYYYTVQNITVIIDGVTVYDYPKSEGQKKLYSGVTTLATGTMTIAHGSDGSKTFSASVSAGIYEWAPNCSGSATFALNQIARSSTLTASNGTLGVSQVLTVNRKSDNLTHTITYACGTATGTVCTKSSSTSISWTPPLNLATQNTTGSTVTVKMTITTYLESTDIGSSTTTITCDIPDSVVPSISVSTKRVAYVTDSYTTSWWDKNHPNDFVQSLTKVAISINASMSYGAAIKSYRTTFDGKTYTGQSFTADAPSKSGSMSMSITVTDSRGRSNTVYPSIAVLPYEKPRITEIKAYRYSSDYNAEDYNGANAIIIPTYSVPASYNTDSIWLDDQNTCTIFYKKTSEAVWNELMRIEDMFESEFSPSTFSAIGLDASDLTFAADTGSSYDIKIELTDHVQTVTASARLGTGFSLMHWNVEGNGMGIGKRSELENVLDIGLTSKFSGGLEPLVLSVNTDLNDVVTPNMYVGADISSNGYLNCPVSSGTFSLEVLSVASAGGTVIQRFTGNYNKNYETYERLGSKLLTYTWTDWVRISGSSYPNNNLLWSTPTAGGYLMGSGQSIMLSSSISDQKNGIVLVFANGSSTYNSWQTFFVPKRMIELAGTQSYEFTMFGANFYYATTKKLYIQNTSIMGDSSNTASGTANGITYYNQAFKLIYVLGV